MRSKTFILLLTLITANICKAQFYRSLLPSPGFTDSLNKLVDDFSTNYYNIQGDVVSEQEDVDVYKSKKSLPGALQSSIMRFHSDTDTSASLQLLMYKGDDYKEAEKIYKNTFRLVNKAKLNIKSGTASFSGVLEEPDESLRFASSSLKINLTDKLYKNFIAEVEIVNDFAGWEVHLNLQSKKDDRDKYMQ